MKKTVSFSLEEDTIDFLESLKEKYNVATRSAALEKFIDESKDNKKSNKEEIKKLIKEVLSEMKIDVAAITVDHQEKVEEIIKDSLDESISNTFDDMPE